MTRKLFTGLLLLAVALSGCTLSTSNAQDSAAETDAPRAWFDAPLPNTVYFPPSPCQIVAHGASPGGIATFELSINGAVTASIPSPDTQSSLVTLTQDCGLSEPGNYLLQLRAQDNDGNWSGLAQTNLIIAAPEEATATPPPPEQPAPEIPTPTLTPTTEPTGGVSIESVSTDLVYLGGSDCGPVDVTITARATAPKDIQVVVLFYRFETGNSSAGFESASMNPIGDDLYRGNLNPTSLLGGSIPFDQATLQYQVVVQQSDGDTSIRTPVIADIAVQACGSVTTVDCSSYTTERTCIANGCNWVSIPAAVPLFACQNP
jgi:hypothetical protein